MALPTSGRVILETTVGEIEIELWAKETPKTCRNFLALAMEGYYDGVIFHRVVPQFLVQTGDRTGTGGGGESFYGEPFDDEIHPRLRFAHRGLVAMANNGQKNTNDSQFFITLDRADELHGKHTLFGKVVGNTIFNAIKIGEVEIDKNERPIYPPKIKSIKIIDNPFDDIVPRITAAEKQAQKRAREETQREREETARRKGAKKNVGLLSFGDAAEDLEPVSFKKKPISRPDLMDDPSAVAVPDMPAPASKETKKSLSTEPNSNKGTSKPSVPTITTIRQQHAQEQASGSLSRETEIAKMEADIKRLARRRAGGDDSDDEEHTKKKSKSGPSELEQELAKYRNKSSKSKAVKGKKRDEGGVLAALDRFRSKLRQSAEAPGVVDEGADVDPKELDVDDDIGWMGHSLSFPKGNETEETKAEHDYEVIDPRVRSQAAKDAEAARKRLQKSHVGKAFRR